MEKNTAGVFNAAFLPWPFDMAVLRNTLRRETAIKVSMSALQGEAVQWKPRRNTRFCQKRYHGIKTQTNLKAIILTLKTEVQNKTIITLDQLNFFHWPSNKTSHSNTQ